MPSPIEPIYCVKCKKKTQTVCPTIKTTKNNRLMLTGTCSVCLRGKCKFISMSDVEKLQALHVGAGLEQIPIIGPIIQGIMSIFGGKGLKKAPRKKKA